MLSRAFGAAVAVFVVGAASAQPPDPLPIPAGDPAVVGDPSSDVLFGRTRAERALDSGGPVYDRWWVTGEYFLGYTRPGTLPPIATSGTADSLAVLGRTGTRVLLGGEQDFGGVSGGRFGAGLWLDPCRAYGFEWGVFFLPTQRSSFTADSTTAAALGRPFFDTNLGIENVRLVSLAGQFDGRMSGEYSTLFWGGEMGMAVRVLETSTFTLEQLFHARYYGLEEKVGVNDVVTAVPGGGAIFFNGQAQPLGATVAVSDFYSVVNRWVGGAGGLRVNWSSGRVLVSVTGRLGIGAMMTTLTADGETRLTGSGADASLRTGILTAGRPTRRVTDVDISFAPEVGARVGYRLTDHITASVGYQYLYMTNVARVEQQLNRNVDPTRVPSGQNFGAAANAPIGRLDVQRGYYWMHGLAVGLTFSF